MDRQLEGNGKYVSINMRVSENRVLRRIYGPKREQVAGGWRRLHNEELHNLYAPPNIIRVIISRRVRWAGHVARMEAMKTSRDETTRKT
jgi:hypothetical protein